MCEECDQIILVAPVAEGELVDELLGRYLDDRYELEATLGEGGAGRVYRARQVDLDRPVAVKVLLKELCREPVMNARFHQEARAASKMDHPGAVTVHDFGEWEGRLFIVMELLDGCSLGDVIANGEPLSDERIVDMLAQVCEVLEVAHTQGMVHRDLKPDNVMVIQRGGVEVMKVVDFGLAFFTRTPADQRLTQEQTVVGTPAYMSPEQCRAQDVTPSTDIYSLGVMLYEMLVGELPFESKSTMDLMIKTILATPVPPSKRCPDRVINPRLESLALQAMAKVPEARPDTVGDFRDRLHAAIGAEAEKEAGHHRGTGGGGSDRMARAAAASLRTVPDLAVADPGGVRLVCVEARGDGLDSLTTVARGLGFEVLTVPDLRTLADELGVLSPELVLVDLGSDAIVALGVVEQRSEALRALPFVVVGPADDISVMTRALELGLDDYIPASMLARKLPRSVKRALRKRRGRAS